MRVNISHARLRNSQFLRWLAEKNAAEPAPQKPDARAWITRRHGPVRRNGICGGLGSDYLHPSAAGFISSDNNAHHSAVAVIDNLLHCILKLCLAFIPDHGNFTPDTIHH